MPDIDKHEPPSFTLPGMDLHFQRAGAPLQQRDLRDLAWTMLEPYTLPSGIIASRLSNEWLGAHNWRVQFIEASPLTKSDDRFLQPLVAALMHTQNRSLLGTAVVMGDAKISAVWRLPVESRVLGLYFNAHQINRSLLYSKALDFTVYAFERIYAVYAGPEDFVRAALPYSAVGAAATHWVREGVEEEHGPGCMDSILEHYAPFMLD